MKLSKITDKGIASVIEWCRDTDADFLRQWSGRNYTFPITAGQIASRLNGGARIFQAESDGETVGTIEILDITDNGKTAYVGCFLIKPGLRGRGYGGEMLKRMKLYCTERGFSALSLCVFDYNVGARRCYAKSGFTEYERQSRGDCFAIYMRAEI